MFATNTTVVLRSAVQGVRNSRLEISCARCSQQQSWDQLSKVFAAAVSRSVIQSVCSSSLKISHPKCLQQQSQDRASKVFANSKNVFLKVTGWFQQESWYSIDFIFRRFLLICQLEGLNLTFTLKWFFLLKYFRTISETVWEQVFQVFLRADLQNMFSRFFDLWAADFCWEYLGYIFF